MSMMKVDARSSIGLVIASMILPKPSQLLPEFDTISRRGGISLPGWIALCVLGFPYNLAGVGLGGIAFSASFSPTKPIFICTYPPETVWKNPYSVCGYVDFHIEGVFFNWCLPKNHTFLMGFTMKSDT